MQKMIKFDDVAKENMKKHTSNWPQIPDHPHRILIIGGSVNHQPDIDKTYLYAHDPYEATY